MSPRLGSNFAKNKENINNNLFTKVSQPQRPISKGKPQFL